VELLNFGSEGLFVGTTVLNGTTSTLLFQVNGDGSIISLGDRSEYTRSGSVVIWSQPLILQDSTTSPHSVSGVDIVSQSVLWRSNDPFLVGTNFTGGPGWPHFSTNYYRLYLQPSLFIVWNCATNGQDVITSVALYDKTSGQMVSQSMNFTLRNLTHPESNPTVWEFSAEAILAVRSDEYWYMLSVPKLSIVNQGRWMTNDTGIIGNAWLVDVDGSYILLDYGYGNNSIQGYHSRTRPGVELTPIKEDIAVAGEGVDEGVVAVDA